METDKRKGNPHIGCRVTSCRYHCDDSRCELEHIEVKPCRGNCSETGRPDDESFCGSYCTK